MEGGESAAAFGNQYNYKWNQIDGYNENTTPKYTEFVEVQFNEPVFIIAVDSGSFVKL